MRKVTLFLMACWVAMAVPRPCSAETPPETLTVAVFDFQTKDPKQAELGALAADLIRVRLGANERLRQVERQNLKKIVEEQTLGVAGITAEAAPRIGVLLGAQVLISGRLFDVGGNRYITVKVIGVETGRVYSEMAKGSEDDLDALAFDLGDKVGQLIEKGRDTLVARVRLSADELKLLRKKLGDKPRPRVFVHVRERMIDAPAPDPAAQNEIQHILLKSGIVVVKDRSGDLKKWAEEYLADGGKKAPPRSSGIDMILLGEGFSQFAARTGDLLSCRARVELEAIDIATGQLLASDKEVKSALDLTEQLAAKNALETAAGRLAFRVIPDAVGKWRALKTKK